MVYISTIPDYGDNFGGYYCQVYADESMDEQLDDFCIHASELVHRKLDDILKEQYAYYNHRFRE